MYWVPDPPVGIRRPPGHSSGGGVPVRGGSPGIGGAITQGMGQELINVAKGAVVGVAIVTAFPWAAGALMYGGTFFAGYAIGNSLFQMMTGLQVDGFGNLTGKSLTSEEIAGLGGKTVVDIAALGLGIVMAGGGGSGTGGCDGKITCFVAGTPVLVPDDRESEPSIVSATVGGSTEPVGQDWLLAAGMIMVGIAGYRDEEKRARRAGKPRKATLEFFFGVRDNDGDDDQDFDPRADGPREFEHWRNGVDRALSATGACLECGNSMPLFEPSRGVGPVKRVPTQTADCVHYPTLTTPKRKNLMGARSASQGIAIPSLASSDLSSCRGIPKTSRCASAKRSARRGR